MLHTNSADFSIPTVSDKIHKRHTKAAIKQARNLSEIDIKRVQGRFQTEGITIDSLASPDLDDGVHIEKLEGKKGWRLFISIASPTELIEPYSPIELEALMRATSVYFGESHIYHMLPNIIATNLASLNHKKHRLTLTLELEINKDFEVVKKDLYKSLFYNRQRHNPDSFTRGINNTSEGEYEYFSIMHELARGLRQRRENDMRIDSFDDADRRITMGEKIHGYDNSHISSFVIQEFMLLANMQTALLMVQESVNGIFRLHMPEYEHIQELPKVLDRAEYSHIPGFHKGLGLGPYAHSTSPIRRKADYISQRQLISHLDGNSGFYTSEQIEQLCSFINMQLTATISHQKEENLDNHGKRIIRKGKKEGDGLYLSMKSHIKQRQEKGLRTPKSIRDEIIRNIRDTGTVEDWVIRTFLLSGEKEIVEEMRDSILTDHSTRKYINMFSCIEGIDFTESQFVQDGILYYRIHGNINGKKFTHSSKISGEYEQIGVSRLRHRLRKTQIFLQNTVPDILVKSNKHAKIVSLDDREFLTSREEFRKAKVATLKKAIARTFEEIL